MKVNRNYRFRIDEHSEQYDEKTIAHLVLKAVK